MNLKFIGGILMILGTSIGAGMLALPIASATEGFITSTILLILCWFVMTIGALLILEVILWLPENTNMISMAKLTLGKHWQIVAWISYLLLLYALLCAYISGNSDILQSALLAIHISIPRWLSTVCIVLILGNIIYQGVYSVDIVNRSLMTIKLIIYFLLILTVAPHIQIHHLMYSNTKISIVTIMVMITSFGFAIIIPSLRTYFKSNIQQLRKIILIGSAIPLIFYIIWAAIVQGVLPNNILKHLAISVHTTTGLSHQLSLQVNNLWIGSFIHIFTSICALTSFLGVSLCLFDFLADGFNLKKRGKEGWLVCSITFLPPLLIILYAPGAFILALSYAGIFCIMVLILLPALMAWHGRYVKKIHGEYKVWGGKPLLIIELLASVILIGWKVIHIIT